MMKKIAIISILIILLAGFGFWWLWGENFKDSSQITYSETKKTEIKGSHVSLAINEILLFKTPEDDYGAVRFERVTNEPGADYLSWFLKSTSNISTFKMIKTQKGHVFEKYWRTRTGLDSHTVTDIGGKYKIQCGPIELGWSASTWVYFPPGYEISITGKNAINAIDVKDTALTWHKT